jgi:hypothetical protein
MAKKKKSEVTSSLQFEADGVLFKFVYPQIEVDKVVYKAKELCEAKQGSKEESILAHLVSIGSGAIEAVKNEGGSNA